MDDTSPATKADINLIRMDFSELKTDVSGLKTDVSGLKTDFSGLKTDVSDLKTDVIGLAKRIGNVEIGMDRLKNDLIEHINLKAKETQEHFEVVAENLKHDFWGIHNDKISVLDDRSKNHEERLTVVEKQLAI
jgi:hypothetical protein